MHRDSKGTDSCTPCHPHHQTVLHRSAENKVKAQAANAEMERKLGQKGVVANKLLDKIRKMVQAS